MSNSSIFSINGLNKKMKRAQIRFRWARTSEVRISGMVFPQVKCRLGKREYQKTRNSKKIERESKLHLRSWPWKKAKRY